MAEDVIIVLSAATSAAFVVMSVILLVRYRKLVSTANESSRLARDLWDALEARLKSQNERIVDLMAKVELYGVQLARQVPLETTRVVPPQVSRVAPREPEQMREEFIEAPPQELAELVGQVTGEMKKPSTPPVEVRLGNTELNVLKALSEGPRTSVEINKFISKSREHTARLLKILFEYRLVERDARQKPFVYQLTREGRRYLDSSSG